MISNTPCAPSLDNFQNSSFTQQESWENYLNNEPGCTYSLYPPASGASEMVFDMPLESSGPMEEEFSSFHQLYNRNSHQEPGFLPHAAEGGASEVFQAQMGSDGPCNDYGDSECTRSEFETEKDEAASVSTGASRVNRLMSMNGDEMSCTTENQDNMPMSSDLETELTRRAMNFIRNRSKEEKDYIRRVLPLLMASLMEIYEQHHLPLNDQIVGSILTDLLSGKEMMIGAERKVFTTIIETEMDDVKSSRPEKMVTEDDLIMTNRKEKKATKGNRNTSSLNHLNENYVSNIFQFAKRNFPEDKEIQRIGNERNVSASNFRKLIEPRLTDDIMTRKAKARIEESGRELVGNIEYWMTNGYFDQCADREKYISYKEKALKDLDLVRKE